MQNTRLIVVALAIAAVGGSAGAATPRNANLVKLQTHLNGGYGTGGDYGTIIGPKVKVLQPGQTVMINPQPLPPKTQR